MMKKNTRKYNTNRENGYKSTLEENNAIRLIQEGLAPNYEARILKYIIPESAHTYRPDFPVSDRIIIETKGRFLPDDRKKMLLIKSQYPDIDFRFVFSNSKAKITKSSKTTYADWCLKFGFKYADKLIPLEWIREIKKERKNGNKRTKNN